jgi:hypothetical protein
MMRQAWITNADTSMQQLSAVSRATIYAHQKPKIVDELAHNYQRGIHASPVLR